MNKRIFIFGGVFVSLCMLFLVHCVKSSNKNKEKYFISIEKQSDKGVTMTIKKNDNKTVVNTCQLEKKNSLTNDKFQNVYSLQDNDIAEILSNSECEFLDGNNKKIEDKSLLAIGTLERIHNPILRFFFSCIFKDKQYVIYCDDANSVKVGEDVYGLFRGSAATKIVVLSCGNNITNMRAMFYNCSSLTELDLSKFNTNNVTDMSWMFAGCISLTSLDLSKLNTHNVTDVRYMFFNCSKLLVLNLYKFNTSNVTDMTSMFNNCSSLTKLDLSNFNTNKVTYMSGMFSDCSSLTILDLSNFNTNKVTSMTSMFYNCFTEEQTSTLICRASTIKKIANSGDSYLTITNEKKTGIENIIGNEDNQGKVYKCSVERNVKEIKPQITAVEEYKRQQ